MPTNQPIWKLVAQVGDVNPVEHGGGLVFADMTGDYPPELEYYAPYGPVAKTADGDDVYQVHVYRCVLEDCTFDASKRILSDNKFHPELPAWFAKPESERATRPKDTTYLADLASFNGMAELELVEMFCSKDPMARAMAWQMVAQYHGWENLDSYPLDLTEEEAKARVAKHKAGGREEKR